MITAEFLKELMRANPFLPFRVCMEDGKVFDVPHRHAAMVMSSNIRVGVDMDHTGIPGDTVACYYERIKTVEMIP